MGDARLLPFNYRDYNKPKHSRTLNKSICIPSIIQSYNMAVQFARHWFIDNFREGNPFKSVYVDGKHIYDEFRTQTKLELIKRPKPSLAIVPSIDLQFNNDNLDGYAFGLDMYRPRGGLWKDSFFKDHENNIFLGMGMQTLLVNFNIKCRVETRGQQVDMVKYIQAAHRVGQIYGEDVDIDMHVPYGMMIQIAEDAGFEVEYDKDAKHYPKVKQLHAFLSYLNTHSSLPFLYKFRAENGHNEFFVRMQRMYVNINPSDISYDDGDKEGHLNNNFLIDLNVEIRFPAPMMYIYYSSNEHKIKTVYGTWNQATGIISSIACFKGYDIPKVNAHGWNMWLSTTYEEDDREPGEHTLEIDFSELFENELKVYIDDCLRQGISPSIFCDIIMVNGGERVIGKMNWESRVFTSSAPVRSNGTFIGLYLDMEYMNNYLICTTDANKNRIQHTKSEDTTYTRPTSNYNPPR